MEKRISYGDWALVVCVLIFFSFDACDVAGQPVPPRMPDRLMLARICASEAGFDPSDDCAAIYAVLSGIAQRHQMSFASAARAYSGRVFDPSRRDARAYLAYLDLRGNEPAYWPTTHSTRRHDGSVLLRPHAPWRSYRERWVGLVEHARQILAGEIVHRCTEAPNHWGGSMDRERAVRMRLREIDCGETLNDFYVLPDPLTSVD